ncbi:MAG: class A beta-lactamase [Bacteroidia bacterium]|nr:class A beta-lactamase [Bacteroidia bacterium]
MKKIFLTITAIWCTGFNLCAQQTDSNGKMQLIKSLEQTISRYKATVGLAVYEQQTGDTFSINNHIAFATQSVYKFPLALAVLSRVESGKISLQQKVFLSKEMLDRFSWSPLKKQNPGSNFYMSVDSLLMYMITYSDNLSCDLLFQLLGGTQAVDAFIRNKGFNDIHIKFTEAEVGAKPQRMYENTSSPVAMTRLLEAFHERKILNEANTRYLLNFMINDSTSHMRLLGQLPDSIKAAHKTGTGSWNDTLIGACNDVGIIYLPGKGHVTISVFVMNANENYENTEKLIAILAKDIYDYYRRKN